MKTVNGPPNSPADLQLWSPLEALALGGLNMTAFGFLLGQGNYHYVFSLMLPASSLALAVALAQTAYQSWSNKRGDM
ncbi:hypothetical protein KO498_05330 [Lentibacter algarum]|uniref:hypothetical protein n=1 Tax=Lentibacter algarum TaxID=576131 RepID=UPI001C076261|nr:hypothetical protein [Lentibacter algarum]MBU2981229.1 hypothetical protein [Lentibacter algarum]